MSKPEEDFFKRLAQIESSGNARAKSKTSSATGLYQMTRPTFEDLRKNNPSLRNITWEQHEQDPAIQRKFAQTLLSQNESQLAKRGHDVNDLNRYLAHFAGVSGADKLLRADAGASVGDVLGRAASKANKTLAGMNVGQLKDFFSKKLGITPTAQAPTKLAANQPSPTPTNLQTMLGLPNLSAVRAQLPMYRASNQPSESSSTVLSSSVTPFASGLLSNSVGAARGGMISRYASGGSTNSAPWEDYAKAPASTSATSANAASAPSDQSSSESNPWDDYKAAASPAKKTKVGKSLTLPASDSFSDRAKAFLTNAFSKSAEALNTRPEQVSGSLTGGGFKVRDKTAQEENLGPTGAANRAKRMAGFLQGAVFDLPAAVGQILPGQTGEKLANQQLAAYQDFRNQLGGKDEFDLSRIAGNIANPVQIKAATGIDKLLKPTGAGLFKRGAAQGAVAGATAPVLPDEAGNTEGLLTEKLAQTGGGALAGGALNKLLGRFVPSATGGGAGQPGSPVERYNQMFPDADLTWGQQLGGRWNRAEQVLQSTPFLGNVIREARHKALESQNVGIMNKALKDAGLKLDKSTQAGRGMFDEAYNKLTNKYNTLLDDTRLDDPQALRAKIYGGMNTGTGSSLATPNQLANSYKPGVISNDYNRLSEAGQQRFDKILESSLFSKFRKDPQGNPSLGMKGNEFKAYEEDLKDVIGDFMAGGGEDRMIGRMLKKSLGEVYDSLTSSNPKVAKELKGLNKSYAQYKTLEKASTASGASEGMFTPAQTIRAASTGARNRSSVGRGKGLLQDEADLSQEVLGAHFPDSGTANRLNSGNMFRSLVGGALSLPAELLYSPKVSSTVLQGGAKAKRAFQNTALGKKIADYAPKGVPAAVRAIMSPSQRRELEEAEEEQTIPIARGGLVGGLKSYADGGSVVDSYLSRKVDEATLAKLAQMPPSAPMQPPGGATATPNAAAGMSPSPPPPGGPPSMSRGGLIGGQVRHYDVGGEVVSAGAGSQASPYGPTLSELKDKYLSHLDQNISQGRKDMDAALDLTKDKGIHVADRDAYKRTLDNMNLAGTFIGPTSKLWNKAAESEFVKREGKEPLEKLWKELGVGRDPSGALKQEISDLGASITGKVGAMPARAQTILEHPELFKAYPHLKELFMIRGSGGPRGFYQQAVNSKTGAPEWERIMLNTSKLPTDDVQRSVALHEFQHAIQNAEKWLPGGSSKVEGAAMAKKLGMKSPKETEAQRAFLDQVLKSAKNEAVPDEKAIARIEKMVKDANKKVVQPEDKFKAYQRLMGEAEARLTQRRMLLNDNARREQYPFATSQYGYDVPVEELITGGYRGFPTKKP